jgi:hypothetical protein
MYPEEDHSEQALSVNMVREQLLRQGVRFTERENTDLTKLQCYNHLAVLPFRKLRPGAKLIKHNHHPYLTRML